LKNIRSDLLPARELGTITALEVSVRSSTAVLLVVAMFVGGCCRSLPASIKAEIGFLDTVVSTAVKETAEIQDAEQRAEKAVRALKRAAPHTDNLRRWVEGEEAADGN
jgi:hypothetical protein